MNFNEHRLAEDTLARDQALGLESFIVSAPAGAGKTELLTQRFLKLLTTVAHPEEVLALTFTNKAASEMRNRILESLERAGGSERPEATHQRITYDLGLAVLKRDREKNWQLLEHPGRLRITTIDALCASLARQLPLLSRFGGTPSVVDDATPHYRAAAQETLASLENDDASGDDVALALSYLNNEASKLENLLVQMLSRRDQWLGHAHRMDDDDLRQEAEAGFAALLGEDWRLAGQAFDARAQALIMPTARYAAALLAQSQPDHVIASLRDWQQPLVGEPDEQRQWLGLCALLLTTEGQFRKTFNKNQGLPAGAEGKPHKDLLLSFCEQQDERCLAALQQVRQLPAPFYPDPEWEIVAAFSRLLKLAAAHLMLIFQGAEEVDFIEMASRASAALGDEEHPTDLALSLDYRIQHLLVDEFQDTSLSQVELFQKLTRGWQPGDGHTLFLVGDPMQSIYRFRKADVGLFLRVQESGLGGLQPKPLRLYRNNRSYPAVIAWINRQFPQVFPTASNPRRAAVTYTEFAATKEDETSAGVHIHPVIDRKDDESPHALTVEARCVVDVIVATRQSRPQERIAVLVRAKHHLHEIVAEIRRHHGDLPFQAVEIEGLAGRQAVQDVLSLSRALLHRADRVHWLAILRAPWCGLTLTDLHVLAGEEHHNTLWRRMNDPGCVDRLSDDGRGRLLHVRHILAAALEHQGRQHPRRWIEGVWLRLNGPRCLATPEEANDVQALFQLMDKLVAEGKFSADELQHSLAKLFAQPAASAESGNVQMMTIHKSKGLEFDTVIVPGLGREGRQSDKPLMLWDEVLMDGLQEALVIAPTSGFHHPDQEPTKYAYLERIERERNAHESERLLYVAATRAIRALHLTAVATIKDDELAPPKKGSLLALLWRDEVHVAFQQALSKPAATESPPSAQKIPLNEFVPKLVRLKAMAVPARFFEREQQPQHETSLAAPCAADRAVNLDNAVGTLVHRCLELIARHGVEHWSPQRPAALEAHYRQWLLNQGLNADHANLGAVRVVQALQATLASPQGRWVLSRHEQAEAELALTSVAQGQPVQHVIDRTFVADGVRWIIDYKTLGSDGTQPHRSMAEQAEIYRPQLERYEKLFQAEELPVKKAIFFASAGQLVELS